MQKTNGATQPQANGKKIETTVPVVTPKKEETKKEETKKELSDLPPVEDRILKINRLTSLVEKHETLLETQQKLNAFKLSTDGNRDTLKISDSKGKEFVTTNSSVIADIIESLKTSVSAKVKEVEAQLVF